MLCCTTSNELNTFCPLLNPCPPGNRILQRRQKSTAATQAFSAALGILHQRPAPSPAYPPAPQPPPPPPPPAFAATPRPPVEETAPTPQAPAVDPAAGSESLYHGGTAPRLEPSALASAYSPSGGSRGAWWEGGEGTGVEPRYGQRHRQPQQHTAVPDTGNEFPGSPAPAFRGDAGREQPRSARRPDGAAGAGERELLTRSEIQRIVDDAVMNGTGRRGTVGGGGDDVTGVGASSAAGAERPGVGYRWRGTAPGYGTGSSLLGGGVGGGGRKAAATAAAAAPTAAAFAGRRRDTVWLSSRSPATAIGRTPAERGISAGAARVGGPPPPPKATNSGAGGGKSGRGGGGGSARFGGGYSLGPRAVTREDLTRLDNEIANLSKTVEEVSFQRPGGCGRGVFLSRARRCCVLVVVECACVLGLAVEL